MDIKDELRNIETTLSRGSDRVENLLDQLLESMDDLVSTLDRMANAFEEFAKREEIEDASESSE